MSRLIAAVARFALAEFGPLIVFWALAATLGVKPAILGSILFIVADAAWRWLEGLTFTRLYFLMSAPDPRLRPYRSRFDLAIHAQIRSGDHQCGDRPRFRRRRAGREADHAGGRRAARRNLCRHQGDSRLLPPVHACLGGVLLPQGGALFAWMAWTMPMLEAMALSSVDRRRQSRPDDRRQRRPRAGGCFSSAAASACCPSPKRPPQGAAALPASPP